MFSKQSKTVTKKLFLLLLARGCTVGILPANRFNRSIVTLGNTAGNRHVCHLRWLVLARWEMGEILEFFPDLDPSGPVAGLGWRIPWKFLLLLQRSTNWQGLGRRWSAVPKFEVPREFGALEHFDSFLNCLGLASAGSSRLDSPLTDPYWLVFSAVPVWH